MEAIGWVSSFILVLTLGRQVFKQWQSDSVEGVSKWLFLGQVAASVGFLIYSALLKNWVFLVTNVLMILNALAGLGIVAMHRRRKPGGPRPA